MTDREMLELAAKAAGMWVASFEISESSDLPIYDARLGFGLAYTKGWWNPLADDGDALRLMTVMYGKHFRLEGGSGGVLVTVSHPSVMADEWTPVEDVPFDRNAATRRAIVRAAAEIGRGMG